MIGECTNSGAKRVKVAVIGTGLAGLATAYYLQQECDDKVDYEVHLFEKSDSLGMDASSISIKTDGGTFRVDSPMRSINGGSHDAVWKLYQELGIDLRRADFSYTFSRLSNTLTIPLVITSPPSYHPTNSRTPSPERTETAERPAQEPVFIYEGSNGFKFPPLAVPSSFGIFRRIPYLLHLVFLSLSYLHLLLLAFFYTTSGLARSRKTGPMMTLWYSLGLKNVGNEPLGKFCERHRIWGAMRHEVLEPLVAAVCTVGRDEVGDLPTEEILDYICATFGSSHYVAAQGVQQVVSALAAPIPESQIHLSTIITDIMPNPANPFQKRLIFTPGSSPLDFDVVVLATQANHARILLGQYRDNLDNVIAEKQEQERMDALGAFEYVPSLVVTHWDDSMLPPSPRDRRDLNLVSFATQPSSKPSPPPTPSDHTVARTSIQATHIISRTHPALAAALPRGTELLQTTNPIIRVDPGLVLSEAWYERAKVSVGGKQVLPRFLLSEPGGGDLQGLRGIWFTGSWCAEGLPLLEGCVTSARLAVDSIRKKCIE